jgi:hypothetical protein
MEAILGRRVAQAMSLRRKSGIIHHMIMTLSRREDGGLRLRQQLLRPVVYLDHWAVRLFSDNEPLRRRFVDALHRAGGTWLFSAMNICEFTAMDDMAQAEAAERLLLEAYPAIHVADTIADPGYFFRGGVPHDPGEPERNWLLRDMLSRAEIAGGFTTHRFVRDAIDHRDMLRPMFEDMKRTIVEAVMATAQDPLRNAVARRFVPLPGMTLRTALIHELIREPYLDHRRHRLDDNDATDLLHTVPSAVVADFTLLDARWCHKLDSARRRLRKGGVTGRIAEAFSHRTVGDFLSAFEAHPHDGRPA